MLKAFSKAIAPGFYCRNDSDIPIVFVFSQLSPLHWAKIEPGETKHIKCGRVFFTASVDPWYPGAEPTQMEVASRIGTIVATTVFLGGFIGMGVIGGLSGITSIRSVQMDGVLADGRVMVIRGRRTEHTVYELYIHSIENP